MENGKLLKKAGTTPAKKTPTRRRSTTRQP